MYAISSSEILRSIPAARITVLPDNWFQQLDLQQTVFDSLTQWLITKKVVPRNSRNLHKILYLGRGLFKRLIDAEQRRQRRAYGLTGDALNEAVAWVCIENSPLCSLGNCYLPSEIILTIPESRFPELSRLAADSYQVQRRQHIESIRATAEGENFYHWMITQAGRPDSVGELARYIQLDANWPHSIDNLDFLKLYLESQDSGHPFIEVLAKAWLEYQHKSPCRGHYPADLTPTVDQDIRTMSAVLREAAH